MKRLVILSLIIIIILPTLTGCWGSHELNELALVTGLGIDKTDNGYKVTVQVVDPSAISTQQAAPQTTAVNTYQAEGKTLLEALQKMTLDSPRMLYSAHIRIIVFGERFAEEGIDKMLDFIFRNHEMRSDFFLLVAKKTTAAKVLNIITALDKLPADKVHKSLQLSQELWGNTAVIQIDELITKLVNKGESPVLNGIEIIGDPESGSTLQNMYDVNIPTRLKLTNLAVFKNGKLIGWLNAKEGIGWNYVVGDIKSTIVNIPCQSGHIGIVVKKSKKKIHAMVVNQEPSINIRLDVTGDAGEIDCQMEATSFKNIQRIQTKTSKIIENDIHSAVYAAQKKYQSDIFGFGEAIHRKNPRYWRTVENEWNAHFSELPVKVNVTFHLQDLDTIKNPFQMNSGG